VETIEAITTRTSIRKYTKEAVPQEIIDDLLKAAMSAPSAGDQRPWHFIVVDDRKILDRVPEFHPYASMMPDAPIAFVICGDSTVGKIADFWIQDCSAAAENLLLAVHGKGLGGVWLAIYPLSSRVEGAKKLFNLPPDIIPLCIIPFGYPAEIKQPKNKYDLNKIHHNVWTID
jgi:nitroreductase